MKKYKKWTKKQLKKARWKRSLERAKKHSYVFGGFIEITGEISD